MTSDPEPPLPDRGPSTSIVDTTWGTVVRTWSTVGIAAAVKLRRLARRRPDGIVILDLRATSTAAPVAVAAVADLAAALRTHQGALRIVRSTRTPQVLLDAADAPEYTSLAEALGARPSSSDLRTVDVPARPTGRLPPATDGRPGMGPDRPPHPPGAPLRTHPTSLAVPHQRRPDAG